jgi:feruloyl esterase
VHVTAETAKKIAAAYYGSAPARSYFFACSTGGRQALIAAQRFPQDFDGIVSAAPVLDFVGTMVNYVGLQKAFAANPVPSSKLKLVADAAYALCDGKDGVKDGLIDNPHLCGFEPAKHLPKCAGVDGPDCFTEGQIRSLETLYSDQMIGGVRAFPAWPVGAEVAVGSGRPGWYNWLVRDDGPPIQVAFSETFFRFLAFPKKDPALKIDQVDLERDLPKLQWIRQTLNATDPDLSGFRDRGGKLLMWFGWADPALNPRVAIEYYESVLKKMGLSTREFFRFYLNPGVFHCGGGVGCDSIPQLATVIDWVEQGKAPERIIASRREGASVTRTRPLCPYPQTARYKGSGSIDDAASFECK